MCFSIVKPYGWLFDLVCFEMEGLWANELPVWGESRTLSTSTATTKAETTETTTTGTMGIRATESIVSGVSVSNCALFYHQTSDYIDGAYSCMTY